jgi:hypothetical protein
MFSFICLFIYLFIFIYLSIWYIHITCHMYIYIVHLSSYMRIFIYVYSHMYIYIYIRIYVKKDQHIKLCQMSCKKYNLILHVRFAQLPNQNSEEKRLSCQVHQKQDECLGNGNNNDSNDDNIL